MTSNSNDIRNPIFICGCHRTGTTLLQKLLSMHPNVEILPETKLYAWLWRPTGSLSASTADKKLTEIKTLMPFVNRAWALPENHNHLDGLRTSAAPSAGFSNVGDVMDHLLKQCTQPGQRAGEKSPLHIYHVEEILRKFPDAKILITKRDLRGAFYSQSMRSRRKKLSYRSFSLFNFVASWTTAIRLADSYLKKYGPDKIRLVEFESLVQSPETSIRSVCEFLGVKFQNSMLSIQFENSSFQDVGSIAGVDSSAASRWRNELDEGIQHRLNYLASDELKLAGYASGKQAPSPADRITKASIRLTTAFAQRFPQLVCYLGRDPRYRILSRKYRDEVLSTTKPKVFVFGNHKSGTTAIAKLLATMCDLSTTIDFPRRLRQTGYNLARGQVDFEFIANTYPELFCKELVKIPALTFSANHVLKRFPDSDSVWVVRDPRDNIRSILNRRKIPGNRQSIPIMHRWWMKIQNKPSMDESIWGGNDRGYIGVLAHRWNHAIDSLNCLDHRTQIIKYEDFVENKQQTLESLANKLELVKNNDIESMLDVQFQPAGNHSIDWLEFFGDENLRTIETICASGMKRFGYQTRVD